MSLRTFLTRAACAVALATFAAACADKEQPTAPKAAAAPAAAAAVAVAAPVARAANGSTVCLAYMNKRADAKVRFDKATAHAKTLAAKKVAETVAEAKARTEWKRKVDKYEAMMADACR